MMPDDLARLHSGIRAAALADDGARLEAMRSKRWITHHPAAGRLRHCRTRLTSRQATGW